MAYLVENLPMLLLVALVASVILAPFLKSTTPSSTRTGQSPVYVVQIDPQQLQRKDLKKNVSQPGSSWARIFLAVLFASMVLAFIAYRADKEPKAEQIIHVDTWEVEDIPQDVIRP